MSCSRRSAQDISYSLGTWQAPVPLSPPHDHDMGFMQCLWLGRLTHASDLRCNLPVPISKQEKLYNKLFHIALSSLQLTVGYSCLTWFTRVVGFSSVTSLLVHPPQHPKKETEPRIVALGSQENPAGSNKQPCNTPATRISNDLVDQLLPELFTQVTPGSNTFTIAPWSPSMARNDDLRGWNCG